MKEVNNTVYVASNGVKFNNKNKCELYEKALKTHYDLLIEQNFILFDKDFNRITKLNCGCGNIGDYALKIKDTPCEIGEMYALEKSYDVQSQLPYCTRDENIDSMFKEEKDTLFQKIKKYDNIYWIKLPNKDEFLKEKTKLENIIKIYDCIKED